nr:MAG TPA: hypothetical protein [Caudoviricetes sp.]
MGTENKTIAINIEITTLNRPHVIWGHSKINNNA